MNSRMNYDFSIVNKVTHGELDFSFKIEHAIAPKMDMTTFEKTNEVRHKYKVISYLYGRLLLGEESFFAEIVGYIDNAQPAIITYHVVAVDPLFFKNYDLDMSNSDFSSSEKIEFT